MSSIVLSGDTSGTVTVAAPAVAGTNTATLPAATGTVMVSGNMPAFSAYMTNGNASQSVTSATFTKVKIDTKEFDTANAFDTSTYRFTPLVAGYYQINGCLTVQATGGVTGAIISIYKNNAEFKRGNQLFYAATNNIDPIVSALIYLNGSTDYIELYGYVVGASGTAIGVGSTQTYFQASMVRAA